MNHFVSFKACIWHHHNWKAALQRWFSNTFNVRTLVLCPWWAWRRCSMPFPNTHQSIMQVNCTFNIISFCWLIKVTKKCLKMSVTHSFYPFLVRNVSVMHSVMHMLIFAPHTLHIRPLHCTSATKWLKIAAWQPVEGIIRFHSFHILSYPQHISNISFSHTLVICFNITEKGTFLPILQRTRNGKARFVWITILFTSITHPFGSVTTT